MEVKQDIRLADGVVPAGSIYGQGKVTRDKQGVTVTEGILTLREPVKLKVLPLLPLHWAPSSWPAVEC